MKNEEIGHLTQRAIRTITNIALSDEAGALEKLEALEKISDFLNVQLEDLKYNNENE